MWSSIRSWSPSASCALPIWSDASGSSPRPIAASVDGCIRRSPGPSLRRWRTARRLPAGSYGDEPARGTVTVGSGEEGRRGRLVGGFGVRQGAEAHAPARSLLLHRARFASRLVFLAGVALGRLLGGGGALHLGHAVGCGRVLFRSLFGLGFARGCGVVALAARHEIDGDALDRLDVGKL